MPPENVSRQLAQMDERIRVLERAVQVKPNGNVEIRATGTLKLEGQVGVEISSSNSVKLFDFFGNEIRLSATGVSVEAMPKFTLNSSTAEVISAMVNISCPLAKFTGVTQCDTLIANNVVGASYTPGAGNIY